MTTNKMSFHHFTPNQQYQQVVPTLQLQPRNSIGNMFECKWSDCGQVFSRLEELSKHLTISHVRTQKSNKGNLASSKLKKSGENSPNAKGFVCKWQGCSGEKLFRDSCNLLIHLRYKHTGERPYQCPHHGCDKRFVQVHHMKKHVRTAHDVNSHFDVVTTLHSPLHEVKKVQKKVEKKGVKRKVSDNLFPTSTSPILSSQTNLKSNQILERTAPNQSYSFGDSDEFNTDEVKTIAALALLEASARISLSNDYFPSTEHLNTDLTLSANDKASVSILSSLQRNQSEPQAKLRFQNQTPSTKVANTFVSEKNAEDKGLRTCKWRGCSITFDLVEQLGRHVAIAHVKGQKVLNRTQKKRGFVCEWQGCNRQKRFNSCYNLEHHLRYKHTGERPFICEINGCKSRFAQASDLKEHKKVHFGEPLRSVSLATSPSSPFSSYSSPIPSSPNSLSPLSPSSSPTSPTLSPCSLNQALPILPLFAAVSTLHNQKQVSTSEDNTDGAYASRVSIHNLVQQSDSSEDPVGGFTFQASY